MKSIWYSSISNKVFLGLLTIVMLTVLSVGMAIVTFNDFSDSFEDVSERRVTALVAASRLVRLSERLSAEAPEILTANNRYIRESLTEEMTKSADLRHAILTSLRKTGVSQDIIDGFAKQSNRIVANLNRLLVLVEQREINDRKIQSVLLFLRRMGQSNQISMPENRDEINEQAVMGWLNVTHQMVINLLSIPAIANPQYLRRLEKGLNEQSTKAGQYLSTMTGDIKRNGRLTLQKILKYAEGEEGIIPLTSRKISLDEKIDTNLAQNKYFTDRLILQVKALFDSMRSEIDNRRTSIEETSHNLGYLLTAIPFVSLISALAIFIFIRRSVTGRVITLRDYMLAATRGNTESILVKGNDELSDMSHALNYFVTELNSREERLLRTAEQAKSANQAKSTFLANMSHELRTPLNAILGTGQIMSRDTDFPEKYKENLGILASSSEYLLSLINDVLEISRIEAGRVDLTKSVFNLKNTLTIIEETTHLRTKKKGLELEVDFDPNIPENIRTDKSKLHQILNNLLDNAIKYTKKGSIIFRVLVVNGSGNREIRDNNHEPASRPTDQSSIINLRFIVEDTGIGISQNNQKDIFDHFVQASTAEGSIKGVGLGLTICRQYATLMGGTISVKSQPGKGSTVTVEVPVESVDDSRILGAVIKPRVVGLEPDQPMFNILIVEDDEASRVVLRQMLEQVGFSVQEAKDGRQAVEMYKLNQPDLVWMDIRLPVMDGMEATKKIRNLECELQNEKEEKSKISDSESKIRNPKCKINRLPIIALSASAFEEDKEKVLEVGCDDFVRKPFREEEIFDIMAQYLEIRYTHEELEKQDKEGIVAREIRPSDLAGLPADWIDRCLEAAKKGKSAEIFDLLKEIKDDNGRVADALAEMARNYKYSEIVALIEKGSSYEK